MFKRVACFAFTLFVPAAVARAQGTITDPPASFVLSASAFDNTPSANFTGVSATLTQDHLFETGWWYRIQGDAAETPFPTPTTQSYVGNVATLGWTDVNGRGFNAQLVYTVVNSGGPSGYVIGQLTITNPGGLALDIDVFNMVDVDLQPTAGDDSATLVTGNNWIHLTDPGGAVAEYRGAGANAFLVRDYNGTRVGTVLGDGAVSNFDNSGLPFGPGDFTGGFQWTTVTILPAGQRTYSMALAVNTTAPLLADLGITKSDALPTYCPGLGLTYTIQVTNAGPDAAIGASVVDAFPADLTNVTWTCTASAGSACAAPSGNGSLNTTADLLVGGTATFIVTATPSLATVGVLVNTVVAAPPPGVVDTNLGDDVAVDTDARLPNCPPVAADDFYSTNEDTPPLVVPAPGVLGNDADPDGDPVTIAILTAPSHGALTVFNITTGAFTYTPVLNYNGLDTFTYQLSDGPTLSGITTVHLTVNPVNDPPVANQDAYTTNEDPGTLSVPALTGVLANDTDVENDPLTAVLDSGPSNAAAFTFIGATGAFSYTPNANFNGVDSFTYHANDGVADSATVTVAITVNSVNDVPSFTKGPNQHVVGGAPTSVDNWATAISSGPANESAQILTFLVTSDHPEFFTAQPAVSPSGTLTFDPAPGANGVATITVRLMDSGGTANGGIDTSAAQTFTILVVDIIVNSANDIDDGVCNATHCSLREAIAFANSALNLPGQRDTISFAIPGPGAHTIAILSPLPAVAEPVVIDATTQPGYTAKPLVELNGTSAGLGIAGLRLGAGLTDVTGLAINRFEGHGIEITGPGTNQISGNFVGTDATGLLARPNGGSGIRVSGSSSNLVRGNLLSGNGRAGVRLEAGADSNFVTDNLIGVGADATTPVPNGENGILVLSGSNNVLNANLIAQNNTQGVQVSAGLHNTIRFNSIQANGLLGIELGADGVTPNDAGDADSGANGLQNYPVLTRATTSPTTTGISGAFSGAPNTALFLDFYVSDACDPSGYGEGVSRLDGQSVTTDAGGQAVIQISSGFAATTAGKYLTATATSPQGDTSEFSACRKIDPLPILTLTGGETAGVLTINEGNPTGGPPTQALTFFVQLSSPSALPVSVTYQTTDGTAQSPSDYLSLSGTLLFAPGETLKQLVVQTVLDNDPETDESFTLSLGAPTNAVPAQSQIQIVLKDDDGAAGPLSLSVADVGVSEPRTGVRSAGFVVSLSDPAFHTVWVDYHTVDGTANAGSDYTSATGQLVFQPGDQTKTIPVDVLADTLREGKETFFLVLTNPQGALLGRGQGTATVGDPRSFFTLKPCRLSDSRQGSGAFAAGELRIFTMTGSCGVPDTAIAISANITVAQPGGLGFIEIFPSDKIAPATSVLNFLGGQTRANNAIIVLSPTGQATVKNVSFGTTHVIIDVNGYFE